MNDAGAAPPAAPRARLTLPRSRRLRRHNDFLRVERSGVRGDGRFVTVVARPGRGRVGFTVSKKVSLKANARNLVKRRLGEVLRAHPDWWAGQDLVVIARPDALGRSLTELAEDVAGAFAALAKHVSNKEPRREQPHATQTRKRRP